MRKSYLAAVLLLTVSLFTMSAFAQTKTGRVSGVAQSSEDKAIDGATVNLLRAKDSSLAKIAVTNKSGEFELEKLADGKYLLKVSAVGFSTWYSNSFELNEANRTFSVQDIKLKHTNKELGAVQVTTRRPLIENKIDRTVVNVEASVTNVGSNALEVLEKSPGVSVDKDGNISLKGKQGVIILIDGKPTYLGGEDLVNLLKNTAAGQIDQIELMSQPPAKFDASGNSGVINIKTKRNKQAGFNGSVSVGYTQGIYPKSSNSLNLNYRKGKINLFANYNYSYWKGFNEIKINRKFTDKDTKVYKGEMDQLTTMNFEGQPHNLKLGADLFASKKTTIGVVLTGFYNLRKGSGSGLAAILDKDGSISSYNQAINSSRDPWKNYGVNFNYRHVYDSTGRELTADADYITYKTNGEQYSNNDLLDRAMSSLGDPYLLRGQLPSNITIYTGKSDYSHPLKGNMKFEAGIKSSYVKTDNNAQFTTYDKATNSWVNEVNRSNHFLYEENINAAYVNMNKQMKKWGVQLGLRFENTNSKGEQLKDNKTFSRHYYQLFPTSYVSYAANKNNNFALSYGRRIERPNYQDMNPFQFLLDRYTYKEGNPYLTPQFSHNIELSHNYKGQLNTSINFTRTTDIINDVLSQIDSTAFQAKKNIAFSRNIGISISYNKPITKIWSINVFANGFNNYFEGTVNNAWLSADITSYMFNMSNQFKFNKGWAAEISGFYRSKTLETGMIVSNPMGVFSLGGSKQILKNKGTIRLNIRDPFWIQKFSGYTKFDNIDAKIQSKWDNRQVSLNFTYRFGKSTGPQKKRSSASQEEQNRVGQNSGQ